MTTRRLRKSMAGPVDSRRLWLDTPQRTWHYTKTADSKFSLHFLYPTPPKVTFLPNRHIPLHWFAVLLVSIVKNSEKITSICTNEGWNRLTKQSTTLKMHYLRARTTIYWIKHKSKIAASPAHELDVVERSLQAQK